MTNTDSSKIMTSRNFTGYSDKGVGRVYTITKDNDGRYSLHTFRLAMDPETDEKFTTRRLAPRHYSTLEAARENIDRPRIRVDRSESDLPCIVETWL